MQRQEEQIVYVASYRQKRPKKPRDIVHDVVKFPSMITRKRLNNMPPRRRAQFLNAYERDCQEEMHRLAALRSAPAVGPMDAYISPAVAAPVVSPPSAAGSSASHALSPLSTGASPNSGFRLWSPYADTHETRAAVRSLHFSRGA